MQLSVPSFVNGAQSNMSKRSPQRLVVSSNSLLSLEIPKSSINHNKSRSHDNYAWNKPPKAPVANSHPLFTRLSASNVRASSENVTRTYPYRLYQLLLNSSPPNSNRPRSKHFLPIGMANVAKTSSGVLESNYLHLLVLGVRGNCPVGPRGIRTVD